MENTEMKQTRVFVMCGPAGSGKSTWLIKQMKPEIDVCISRDNIRFIFLKEGEDYFAHENKVKKIFFDTIANTTSSFEWENIYIDATHLNPKARDRTLWNISKYCSVVAVSFEVPAEVAIERNKKRSGLARVPDNVIWNMKSRYKIPSLDEGFDEIWHVDAEGVITKEVKS
jgi:predicted kinase